MYGKHRGLGDGEVNPDGSPTYDGAPYDPNDPNNPYNFGAVDYYTPVTIPVSSTPIGTGPGTTLVSYTSPLPTTGAVALTTAMFRNPDGTPTYDGAPYSATDVLNPYNLSHFFGIFSTPTSATGAARPTVGVSSASTIGGVSTTTLVVLGIGAALLVAVLGGKGA